MLESLVIQLRHEVLPQHKIERKATSKHLTFEERKKFMEFAPLAKNTYSAAEDERIKANWEAFCEVISSVSIIIFFLYQNKKNDQNSHLSVK